MRASCPGYRRLRSRRPTSAPITREQSAASPRGAVVTRSRSGAALARPSRAPSRNSRGRRQPSGSGGGAPVGDRRYRDVSPAGCCGRKCMASMVKRRRAGTGSSASNCASMLVGCAGVGRGPSCRGGPRPVRSAPGLGRGDGLRAARRPSGRCTWLRGAPSGRAAIRAAPAGGARPQGARPLSGVQHHVTLGHANEMLDVSWPGNRFDVARADRLTAGRADELGL
jgi:hypothetical protein